MESRFAVARWLEVGPGRLISIETTEAFGVN